MMPDKVMRTLTDIRVLTRNGNEHRFPCVAEKDVRDALAAIGSSSTTLTLVNAGGACLTLPFRSVETIEANGETLWKRETRTTTSDA